jgi:CDGSH-type Zn-finger protein
MDDQKKKLAAEFTILPNGPIRVTGKFVIKARGNRIFENEGDEVYLCRCGGTQNAPFCDGSHKTVGVRD